MNTQGSVPNLDHGVTWSSDFAAKSKGKEAIPPITGELAVYMATEFGGPHILKGIVSIRDKLYGLIRSEASAASIDQGFGGFNFKEDAIAKAKADTANYISAISYEHLEMIMTSYDIIEDITGINYNAERKFFQDIVDRKRADPTVDANGRGQPKQYETKLRLASTRDKDGNVISSGRGGRKKHSMSSIAIPTA